MKLRGFCLPLCLCQHEHSLSPCKEIPARFTTLPGNKYVEICLRQQWPLLMPIPLKHIALQGDTGLVHLPPQFVGPAVYQVVQFNGLGPTPPQPSPYLLQDVRRILLMFSSFAMSHTNTNTVFHSARRRQPGQHRSTVSLTRGSQPYQATSTLKFVHGCYGLHLCQYQ